MNTGVHLYQQQRGFKMANIQPTAQLIRVKRKITEDSLVIPNKKCKFVGSCSDLTDDRFKLFLKNLKLDNQELDCDQIDNCNDNFKIVDYGNYDELLSNVPIGYQSNFPQIKESELIKLNRIVYV